MVSGRRASISRTAEAAALGRAIESLRRGADRLFHDPLARGFLRRRSRAAVALMRLPGIARLALSIRERHLPGVIGNLLCRTRFIDDALRESLREGAGQVVILGAGFDSRAYRIPRIEQARVFEVDRPAMIELKRARLNRMFDALPAHVKFVAVDFDDHRLGEALRAAGFQPDQRTFYLWEGVTQYLAQEAIEGVLGFVARTAPGSRIAFTYINRAVVDGSRRQEADRRAIGLAERLGEPWISGFDPAEVGEYLSRGGLAMIAHVEASDYRDRYLRPTGRSLAVYEEERVVVAEVSGPSMPTTARVLGVAAPPNAYETRIT